MSEKKKKCPKSYPSEIATLIFWCGLVFHVFFRKKTKSCLFASCVGRGFCCCYYKSKAMKGHRRKRRKRKWEEGMRRTIALRLTRWAPVVTFGWIPFESLLFPPYNFHTTDKLFVTVCVVVLCIKQYVFWVFFLPSKNQFLPTWRWAGPSWEWMENGELEANFSGGPGNSPQGSVGLWDGGGQGTDGSCMSEMVFSLSSHFFDCLTAQRIEVKSSFPTEIWRLCSIVFWLPIHRWEAPYRSDSCGGPGQAALRYPTIVCWLFQIKIA